MKTHRLGMIAAFALATLVALNTQANAQEKTKDKPLQKPAAGESARRPNAAQAERLAKIKEDLKLTDAQVAKLKPLLQEEAKKIRALRDDTSLSPQDRRAKTRGIREASAPKLKEILTKDQYEQWDKMRTQRPAANAGQKKDRQPKPPTP